MVYGLILLLLSLILLHFLCVQGDCNKLSQLEKRDYMQVALVSKGLIKTKDAIPVAHCKKKE